jgi:hypothetical protein
MTSKRTRLQSTPARRAGQVVRLRLDPGDAANVDVRIESIRIEE